MGGKNSKLNETTFLYNCDTKYLKKQLKLINLKKIQAFIFDYSSFIDKKTTINKQLSKYQKLIEKNIKSFDQLNYKSLYINLSTREVTSLTQNFLEIWNPLAHQIEYFNLSMQSCKIGPQNAIDIAKFMGKCLNLQSICLNFIQNWISTEGITTLMETIQKLNGLTHLHIESDDNGIQRIGNVLFPQQLITFKLSLKNNTQFGEKGALQLSGCFQKSQSIQILSLNLDGCLVLSTGLKSIFSSISYQQQLRILSLDLKSNELDENSLTIFTEIQNLWPQLISFYMSLRQNKGINDKAISHMCVFLQNHPGFSYFGLDLQDTGITKDCPEFLIQQFQNMKELTNLYLNFGQVIKLNSQIQQQISNILNNLPCLTKCVFMPEIGALSADITIAYDIEETKHSNCMAPTSSPFYGFQNYSHIGSCCDPYLIFKFLDGQLTFNIQKQLVMNFLVADSLVQTYLPLVMEKLEDKSIYVVNISKKQIPEILISEKISKTIIKVSKPETIQQEVQIDETLNNSSKLIKQISLNQSANLSKNKQQSEQNELKQSEFCYEYQEFIQQFEILDQRIIQKISYGFVYEGKHRATQTTVAIKKIINLDNSKVKAIKLEINTNIQHNYHLNITKILAYSIVAEQDKISKGVVFTVYAAYEFGQRFIEFMIKTRKNKLLNIPKQLPLLLQINEIILVLETRKSCHLDINPSNFLLFNDFSTIKLTDFGYLKKQRILDDPASQNLYKMGQKDIYPGYTKGWTSPEFDQILLNIDLRKNLKEFDFSYNKSDIYSLGLMFLYIIFRYEQQENEIKEPLTFLNQWREFMPLILFDLINQMLNKKPEKRPTALYIKQQLEQFWKMIGQGNSWQFEG